MRVLHVVPSYLPAVRYGGPIVAVHALCAALARAGCQVNVFTTNTDGRGVSAVPVGVPVEIDGVTVLYFRTRLLRRLYYAPAMDHMLRRHIGGFDLVHLHSVFLWPTWAAARAARRAGVPYLVSPRGMLVKALIARKSPWAKRGWIRLIERRNLERAAAIHVTSDGEAAELRRFGFSLPGVHEVPNGVEVVGGEERAQDGLPPAVAGALSGARPVVLCLGRISWKKGLDRLIPAMARVPHAVLLVIGNDEEHYTPELETLAARAGVRDRVVFAGPLFGPAKALAYRAAAVLVLASYSENFGNVVLEAMAEGCPVVVTPEVGLASAVRESGAGLVATGDEASLSEAIGRLLADRELRERMGGRGQAVVRERFSWDSVAQRMLDVYGACAANATRGGR
jgi:glycosyltransferase involved in cell wall biosynthesis